MPAFIPEDYMADEHRRLVTVQKDIARPGNEELAEIRSGTPGLLWTRSCRGGEPLAVIGIRNLLKTLKGKKMGYDGEGHVGLPPGEKPRRPPPDHRAVPAEGAGVQLTPTEADHPDAGSPGDRNPEAGAGTPRELK